MILSFPPLAATHVGSMPRPKWMGDTERNRMTCEVIAFIEVLEHTKSNHGDIWTPGTYYVCQWADGAVGAVALHNLKPAEAK